MFGRWKLTACGFDIGLGDSDAGDAGAAGRLPTAATCSLRLRVPPFPDAAAMRAALVYAAENCHGFESA